MNLSDNSLDDLTMIKGIGPARQRWLKESLDVRTFGDLAALSADEIESRLKADRQIASRETIEAWIAQADRHTARAAQKSELERRKVAKPRRRSSPRPRGVKQPPYWSNRQRAMVEKHTLHPGEMAGNRSHRLL